MNEVSKWAVECDVGAWNMGIISVPHLYPMLALSWRNTTPLEVHVVRANTGHLIGPLVYGSYECGVSPASQLRRNDRGCQVGE
jgi:hypothetical protein